MLPSGEPVYGMDNVSDSSLITNLSLRYISTQHGTEQDISATGTYSSQHGTASGTYSTQYGGVGGGGYFASEAPQTTTRNFLPGET